MRHNESAPFILREALSEPALVDCPAEELTAVLPSLALGGAERIVLDWIRRLRGRHAVHLVTLRSAVYEHAVPEGVRLTRCAGPAEEMLRRLGRHVAGSRNPLVLCHLLTATQRAALRNEGARPVPVLHNARTGWIDAPADLLDEPRVIVVAQAIGEELRELGYRGVITVIRHVPAPAPHPEGAREFWRSRWNLPRTAIAIGMIGGVKPQKAYPRALRLFRGFSERHPQSRLVILGGPTGRDGMLAWRSLLAQRARLALEERVVLPGFVADAAQCLPAFDVLLNTSTHEGFSMATLEALQAGVPVIASKVGGQGELPDDNLRLLPVEADENQWIGALEASLAARRQPAAWARFPAYRQWTLAQLAAPYAAREHVLFVTANLNAGGAQRSLVNLACAIADRERITVAVAGESTADAFYGQLREAGVDVVRTAAGRDAFDHAEGLLRLGRDRAADTIVFWNADAKVKLLASKFTRSWHGVRLVDVSPGGYAFEEMRQTQPFQQLVAWSADEYYGSLAALVHKYRTRNPDDVRCPARTIRNGVPEPARTKSDYRCGPRPRIVVSGRIAPGKFLLEILDAFALLRRRIPEVQLHIYGAIEPRHRDYGEAVLAKARAVGDEDVRFHGATESAPEVLHQYDVALVLGEQQGCPNSCLEALAAGVPLVANDSGGTREIVRPGKTGWLISTTQPEEIAGALVEALTDRVRAEALARAGLQQVRKDFTIDRMAAGYLRLFAELRGG